MSIFHIVLQVVQFFLAISLIIIVVTQTSKDQGLGGAIGGGDGGGGGSRYTGGYEEKLDNLSRSLAFWFLGISFLVAIVGHYAF